MDTLEGSKGLYRFITLIPHRDATGHLLAYREKLFARGYCGAFSFPISAPLAAISRQFNREEMKELARNIRSLTKETDGRILSDSTIRKSCISQFSLFGQHLKLSINDALFPKSSRGKILHIPGSTILCIGLLGSSEEPASEEGPPLSFRAASIANLAIRPLVNGESAYSFEWKIGPEVWLPKNAIQDL